MGRIIIRNSDDPNVWKTANRILTEIDKGILLSNYGSKDKLFLWREKDRAFVLDLDRSLLYMLRDEDLVISAGGAKAAGGSKACGGAKAGGSKAAGGGNTKAGGGAKAGGSKAAGGGNTKAGARIPVITAEPMPEGARVRHSALPEGLRPLKINAAGFLF